MKEQRAYLEVAREYKRAGAIQKIHLSTRPDYITPEILDNLKEYSVDTIELGVQSFDEEVLRLSGRGHHADVVYQSAALIQDYGFTLGIQLMIGLPGDSLQKCVFSAEETVKIAPKIARLYPTVVLRDTALYEAYQAGSYTPLTEEDAVERTKAMYEILDNAGIQIIRVGLKSSDIMAEETAFHPAFRQLVEGSIARNRLEAQLAELLASLRTHADALPLDEFAAHMKTRETEYEQLLVYFLYRHVPEALDDGDVSSKAAFAVASVRLLFALGALHFLLHGDFTVEDQIALCRLYSAEVEYSDDNMEALFDALM